MILNLLSYNIKRTYNISVKSREEITATLIAFLKESSPYQIHKFDIKSFYESFDRSKIISKLKSDCLLSKKNVDLLELFFLELKENEIKGLPRGIGLSAVLSELMMQEFDNSNKNKSGVFFYARFVDDIIIITDNNSTKKNVKSSISELLPVNLEVHEAGDKIFFSPIGKTKTKPPYDSSFFNYLGYKYTIKTNQSETDFFLEIPRRMVLVDISDDKIKKIKNRLIKTFTSYLSSVKTSDDYTLLTNRIKFLTGNYKLVKTSDVSNVKSGIYYNYSLINQDHQLKIIDNFMRGLLFSTKHSLSLRIQKNINLIKRKNLAHFSFLKGHNFKRFHKFTYKNFMDIKRPWL